VGDQNHRCDPYRAYLGEDFETVAIFVMDAILAFWQLKF
jgi:hypothetical protein